MTLFLFGLWWCHRCQTERAHALCDILQNLQPDVVCFIFQERKRKRREERRGGRGAGEEREEDERKRGREER